MKRITHCGPLMDKGITIRDIEVTRLSNKFVKVGAVLFLEKVSLALAHVDGSSGAIGSAVNNAIDVQLQNGQSLGFHEFFIFKGPVPIPFFKP